MSNASIKQQLVKKIEAFEAGSISIKELKESIKLNGNALEKMPYSAIKAIDEIEYKLTVSQFADEEDCYSNIEDVLKDIEAWLNKVPLDGDS